MNTGELIQGIDPEKEPGLHDFLKGFPPDEELDLDSVRRFIDGGTGSFTETELIFLFIESLFRRVTGENTEW